MDLNARSRVDTVLANYVKRWGIQGTGSWPGFAVSLHVGGKTVVEAGYGDATLQHAIPITPTSVFHVASVSKQFTAYCVALLVLEGTIGLDDDVRTIVPEFPIYGDPIRLHHLLFHTSGLRDDLWVQDFAGWSDDAWISQNDALDLIFRQQGLSFPTGSRQFYSNAGYTLLALIVERLSEKTFADFAHERVFAPLRMDASRFARERGEIVPGRTSAYEMQPNGRLRALAPEVGCAGAIGLLTTIEDVGRWMTHLRSEIRQQTPVGCLLLTQGTLTSGKSVEYAWGFFTTPHRGLRLIRHGGSHGGYRSHTLSLLDHDIDVACFANVSIANPGALCQALVDAVLDLGDDEQQTIHTSSGLSFSLTSPQPGLYRESDWGVWLNLRRDGKGLVLDDREPRPLTRQIDGRYQAAPGGIPVRLAGTGSDDAPDELLVWNGGGDEPDHFTRVEFEAPTSEDLIGFQGSFWSDELGVAYEVGGTADGRHLRLVRQRQAPATLNATGEDSFHFGYFTSQVSLAFERDTAGIVTGFRLSSLRTRNIRFNRAPFEIRMPFTLGTECYNSD